MTRRDAVAPGARASAACGASAPCSSSGLAQRYQRGDTVAASRHRRNGAAPGACVRVTPVAGVVHGVSAPVPRCSGAIAARTSTASTVRRVMGSILAVRRQRCVVDGASSTRVLDGAWCGVEVEVTSTTAQVSFEPDEEGWRCKGGQGTTGRPRAGPMVGDVERPRARRMSAHRPTARVAGANVTLQRPGSPRFRGSVVLQRESHAAEPVARRGGRRRQRRGEDHRDRGLARRSAMARVIVCWP
jgi:hypothetical protein